MDCPCETCIALARCRSRILQDHIQFFLNIQTFCPMYKEYVIEGEKGNQILINYDNAIEAGKFLGYTIDGRTIKGEKQNVFDKQREEISETK